jgi:hypothetical protein
MPVAIAVVEFESSLQRKVDHEENNFSRARNAGITRRSYIHRVHDLGERRRAQ